MVDFPAMFVDDPVRYRQTQAGALTGWAGGKKWLEDTLKYIFCDAFSCICNPNANPIISTMRFTLLWCTWAFQVLALLHLRGDGQFTSLRHRLDRIVD